MKKKRMTTVGKYLTRRLEQAGVRHIFGVPGDYVLGFFDCLEESRIKVIGNCNELNAGYAADAYARANGIGAVCVTYGVGGFSLFNAVVGAFAERVPLIAISGSPKLSIPPEHHLLHHTIGDMKLQYNIYEKITVASVILKNPEQIPQQIDDTISACLRLRRPVYIEIPLDIVSRPCLAPGNFKVDTKIYSDQDTLKEAVNEAAQMLRKAKRPAILAGVESHRLRIRDNLQAFVNHTGYPFATTSLGKAVLPEKHPQFVGVYNGAICRESVRQVIEKADVLLSLGALMTDMNLGAFTEKLDKSKMIAANSDNVRIKRHIYNKVSLEDFMDGLRKKLRRRKPVLAGINHPSKTALKGNFVSISGKKITLKRFYDRVNRFISGGNIVVADTGDSIFNAMDLFLPEGIDYIGQAFYLSIGYAVPASLGLKLATENKRPVVFVGDGAFQMTAQELSTIAWHKLNPIIFLINNEGYTIERLLHDGLYNDINIWKYHKLPEIFGSGWGCQVNTEDELEQALKRAADNPRELAFIEVRVDRWDCSENLKKLGAIFSKRKGL